MFAGLQVKNDEEAAAQAPSGGGMFAGLEMKADEGGAAPGGGGMFAGLKVSDAPAEGSGTAVGGGMFAGLEMGTRSGSNTIGGSEVTRHPLPLPLRVCLPDHVSAPRGRGGSCALQWTAATLSQP